uniref:Uncharacterized protein n=1 Tax=Cannabis sativa TaxID=3483 RepID=A0A803QQE0_CANSA
MADNSQQTDTSTDVDTDERNHFQGMQHGSLVVVDSMDDQSAKVKTGDQKTLRRLAQNREAARKSRLRKKAYVQQLESSRLRLSQLEQELQRARQQGMFIASGFSSDHNQLMAGNGALAFDLDYARWLDEQQRLTNDLRSAVNSHMGDNELRVLVDGVMAHYDEIFRLKSIGAKADVFHMLSGMWKTPAERCFMWLGGFRSSEVLKILGSHLEPLTDQQLLGICNLQQSSQQAEDALSQGMEALQQSLVETLSSATLGPAGSGNVADYMGQMAIAMGKLATLENFLYQADLLRQQTLQQMHRILTTRQAARALLVINDYFSRLRALSSLWLARPRDINPSPISFKPKPSRSFDDPETENGGKRNYNLLEEVKRASDSAQRMRKKLCKYNNYRLPFFLRSVRSAAASRRTKILFLPGGMVKREKNQTTYDKRKKCIYWTIEWQFHSTDVVLLDHGIDENMNISSIIGNHLKPGPWNHQLKRFCDEDPKNLKFFIRKYQKGPISPFYELDFKVPLRQQLTNKVILEYPVIYVFLPSHNIDFEVVKDHYPPLHKPDLKTYDGDNHLKMGGVPFKEEEIVEIDKLAPKVFDFMKNERSMNLASPHQFTNRSMSQKVSVNSSERAMSTRVAPEDGLQSPVSNTNKGAQIGDMEFDFDQGLIDEYSDLIAEINPDDFLDLEGFRSGSLSSGHPVRRFSPCLVWQALYRSIGLMLHTRICNWVRHRKWFKQ